MSVLAFLDIGFSEMLVVAFVALILFGGRLPEVMRTLGSSYRKFRKGMDDVTRQVTRPDLGLDLKDLADPYRPIPPAATTLPPVASRPIDAASPPSPPTSSAPAAVADSPSAGVPVAGAPAPWMPPPTSTTAPAPAPAAPTTTPSRLDDDTPDV